MLVFLIFLAIAGVAACIFANSSQTSAELAGIGTVLSLGMSLIYAPWEVKLVLLVVLLATTRPLLRPRTEEPVSGTEPKEPQPQKALQYRGISYQPASNSADAASPSRDGLRSGAGAGGQRAVPPTAAPDPALKYRGATVPARSPDKT